MKPLNILMIGAGMYVCGRGVDGYGTVVPAICEWKKKNQLNSIYIVGTASKNIKLSKLKVDELQCNMNIKLSVRYFPEGAQANPKCYKEAIHSIPKPACAIIAVPDNLHKEIAISAIQEGLHTLVVKPLAPTLEEVRALMEAQNKNKTYCAVEFHKRFDSANLMLRDVIRNKKIGNPLYFVVEYSQRKSLPTRQFKKWVHSTNIFQYLGIHYVDIVYFATGAVPKRAMAIGQKGYLLSKGIDTWDSIQGVIEWEIAQGQRFTSDILTNWIDPEKTSAMSDQKIKVIGTKGRFESDQKKRGITIVTDEEGIEEPNPYFCAPYGERGNVSYKGYGIDSIGQFLDDVVGIEEGRLKIKDLEGKRPTFKESVVPTAVLEAVNKSLKINGKWIAIRGI